MINLKHPVLVADNNQEDCNAIIDELKKLGFSKFLLASDRKTAATTLYQTEEGEEISLIVVAHEIFEPDGQEYMEMIKSVDEFKETPVIAFSSEIRLELAMRYMDYGALSFLVKPVTARKFAASLLLLKQPTVVEEEDEW